eukprot:TRINITY_DN28630_c0_g1_i1.p1 TRINITY_DN28630_c0_g1~~TRINITY_DN28630_c0_g1_i1.p1  ORF type:complete len:159 (-),score=23.03 TRINITY_DN28630_c0_g1_i1:38-514(-)
MVFTPPTLMKTQFEEKAIQEPDTPKSIALKPEPKASPTMCDGTVSATLQVEDDSTTRLLRASWPMIGTPRVTTTITVTWAARLLIMSFLTTCFQSKSHSKTGTLTTKMLSTCLLTTKTENDEYGAWNSDTKNVQKLRAGGETGRTQRMSLQTETPRTF